jgi:hypothetical protein
MENDLDQYEPGSTDTSNASPNQVPPLLTVSQAYEYLIAGDLPRSKKTIRKWCRLNHVEKKQNTIPGGPKWLITKSSLDTKIAEERLIDASLKHETGANQSELVSPHTHTNPSAPVRDDELIDVLKEQLTHEREARKAAEEKNSELLTKYHEISIASTKVGIEIGKGMQEQGKARQLASGAETGSNHSQDSASSARATDAEIHDASDRDRNASTGGNGQAVDNPVSTNDALDVE